MRDISISTAKPIRFAIIISIVLSVFGSLVTPATPVTQVKAQQSDEGGQSAKLESAVTPPANIDEITKRELAKLEAAYRTANDIRSVSEITPPKPEPQAPVPPATIDPGDTNVVIEPPPQPGEGLPNTFPIEGGDRLRPAKKSKYEPQPAQPLYVMIDLGKLVNGQSSQATVSLQVITPTKSLVDIVVTLPEGIDYEDASSTAAAYDPKARTLTWRGVDTNAKTAFGDMFRLTVNAPSAPATLSLTSIWRTDDGALSGQTTLPIAVGALRASEKLDSKNESVFQATDRVTLTFPPNALQADIAISAVAYEPFTQERPRTIADDGNATVRVNVLPFSFGPDMKFDAPVKVSVNVEGLFPDDVLRDTGLQPVLQYVYTEVVTPDKRTDGTPVTASVQRIEDIPSDYDAKTGVLTAQITHFSNYQVSLQQPVNPQLWKLNANGGNVGLFRGAVSYAYPIQMPGMIDGLQPNLSLNYSSAAGDSGADQKYQPGEWLSLGAGWSMDVPKITRYVSRGWVCPSGVNSSGICGGAYGYDGKYANDFTLSLGGRSYHLASQGGGWYVPEDYAPIRARLCNDQNTCTTANGLAIPGTNANGTYGGNNTGEYWQVWTPDGTRWLFGIDTTTENTVSMRRWDWTYNVERPYAWDTNAWSGYAGHQYASIARAWFLRRVYAPVRDNVASGLWSVQWNYENGTNTVVAPFQTGCGSTCFPSEPDPWARPGSVLYGPSVKPNGTAAMQRWKVLFQYHGWGDGSRLSNIVTSLADVNGNTLKWLRNYEFGGADPLDWIREYGINEYSGQWQSGLPTTNFYYTDYPHNNQPINGSNRKLLSKITNGYGGEWSYDYAGDPVLNSYWVTNAWTKSLIGGVVKWTGRTLYEYSPNKCVANSASAGLCVNAAHVFNNAYPNNLVGYEWVNEKTVDPNNTNTIYAWANHSFHYNNLHKLGREWKTRNGYANGSGQFVAMTAQQTDFYDWNGGTHGLPSGGWFVAPKYVDTYPFGDVGNSPYQRSYSTYDDNGTLVGANVTRQVNYGFVCAVAACTGDEVTTKLGYYPNTSGANWIVNKLAFANTYEGADETTVWPTIPFKTQALLYYDSQSSHTVAPTKGQLTKVGTGNSGNSTEWTTQQVSYDSVGNVATLTDGRGYTTDASYDANGWFLTQVQTPPNGAGVRLSTQYRYYGVDESGCAGGAGTYAGVGVYGLLKCTLDPNGVASASYSYDVFGRLRKIAKPGDTFARPSEEYFYYDTNSPFFSQRFVRNQSGTGVNPSDIGFTNPHSNGGWWYANSAVDLNALAVWERAYADGLGRPIETQAPMADWANTGGQMKIGWTSYDNAGRAYQQSVPYAEPYAGALYREPNTGIAKTSTTYDALSRVTSVTGSDGAITHQRYGNGVSTARVRSVDALGHTKVQASDGLGRLRTVEEYSGIYDVNTGTGATLYATTNYGYDALGNLTSVVDAAGNTTTLTYDRLSRKTQMVDPDMGAWNYGYDPNGNLISQTDANGQTLTFGYDALNRMTDKYVNGAWTSWNRYDETWVTANALGRRTRTGLAAYLGSNYSNTVNTSYDTRGRMTLEQRYVDGGGWFNTSYLYDQADRLTQMTYPTGERVVTSYTSAGNPSQLNSLDWTTSGASLSYVTGASYNVLGQVRDLNLGNGQQTRYRYWALDFTFAPRNNNNYAYGRLRQTCVTGQAAGTCTEAFGAPQAMNVSYDYDVVGNVYNIGDWVRSEVPTFAYDHLDRLTAVSGAYTENYTYNAIGNITSKTGTGSYDYYTWGGCSGYRPHAVRFTTGGSNGNGSGYCYDGNGNMQWRYDNAKLWLQSWDADNKLTGVQQKSTVDWATNIGSPTTFYYDADGNRVCSRPQRMTNNRG